MRFAKRLMVGVCLLTVATGAALAVPTISVNPTSIARDYTGTVQVDIGALQGGSPEAVLRLYVDIDADGVIDVEDYVIWTDSIDDNFSEWSPNMFSDVDPVAGQITVNVRRFTSYDNYTYTVGSYIWEAEDVFDNSTAIETFAVTQAVDAQSVSGTIIDSVSKSPIGGACVYLLPVDMACQGVRGSVLTDVAGNFTIYVPAAMTCSHHILLGARPGYMGSFINQPYFVFTGADNFAGQGFEMMPGVYSITGQLVYETGPDVGAGIPGVAMWADADTAAGPVFAMAFTDENGDYAFMAADGDWSIGEDGDDGLAIQGAVSREDNWVNVTVSGGPAVAPLSQSPAANAFINGTVYDETLTPVPGQFGLSAYRFWPCDPDCYQTSIHSRPDGTFTLGVVGPTSPATYDYSTSIEVVHLPGLVTKSPDQVTLSDGDVKAGQDIFYLTPTSFIKGQVTDMSGAGIEDICVRGSYWDVTSRYESQATTDCNGDYSLPVIDGTWDVRFGGDDEGTLGYYRNLDETRAQRNVTVSGADVGGVNFIIGRWLESPTLTFIEQPSGPAGAHVKLDGFGFSFGSMPTVYFDATPATVLAYRPDLGGIIVEVPALADGVYDVTVYNPDLDKTSNALCYTVAGTFTPACTLSGTASDPSLSPLQDALVIIFEDFDDIFLRAAVTAANGTWSADLEAPGNYDVVYIPPEGQPWLWMLYDSVACTGVQNHTFATGWQVTGQVVSDNFDDISNVEVDAYDDGTGYFTATVTDDDGYFSLYVPTGTFDFEFFAPTGSRFVNNSDQLGVPISSDTDLGQITMDSGFYFSGRARDKSGAGLYASVDAFQNTNPWCTDGTDNDFDSLIDEADECSFSMFSGTTDTDPCTGRFDIALPSGAHRLDIYPDFLAVTGPTQVRHVNLAGDTLSEFDFTVFDENALQYTGPEPRILEMGDEGPYAQEGQPVSIFAENINGAVVDALFTKSGGGTVAGVDTRFDPARGFVATRVPPGVAAGTNDMVVQVDGVDSEPFPFTLLPGLFNQGTLTVSGTVDDGTNPVANVVVLLFWIDPADPDCEDEGILQDYAVTDGSGNYSVTHPGGDLHLVFWAPTATTLASSADELLGVGTNTTLNKTLNTGFTVHIRAVDDDVPPNPVPNAAFDAENDVFDQRLTDANGDATLYLEAGDYDFELMGPCGSRLVTVMGDETYQTISGPFDFGDTQMQRGAFLGGRAAEQDGTAVPGAWVDSWAGTAPYENYFDTMSRQNGLYHGPVPFSSPYQLWIEGPTDNLANFQGRDITIGGNDLIRYPSDVLLPAGFVEGFVRDAVTTNPIADIGIHNHENVGGTPGSGSGWTQSCPDGFYSIKLPVGDHFIHANAGMPNNPSYLEEWYQDTFCGDSATSITVNEGATTTADIDLDPSGSISGNVVGDGLPLPGVQVCASGSALGTCDVCTWTDAFGDYTLALPTAADYRVEANSFYGNQCYDGNDGCGTFDPVSVTVGFDTPNIDFVFGCISPTEQAFDDMETGAPGWTADGLWHLVSEPTCTPSAKSGSWSWYYGQDFSCDYDTGITNTGFLTMPMLTSVPDGATLTFWQRRNTDGGCSTTDITTVEISVNGAPFVQVWEPCFQTNDQWWFVSLDLTPNYTPGDDIQIGFRFDTVDPVNNNSLGWLIDDVRIFTCPPPCTPLSDPLQVDVEGQACGGPITVTTNTPTLAWSNVADENGYEWEVYDAPGCTGSLVASGSTLADTTTAITTPLAGGAYSWRVRATGDGATFCNSNWVCGCEFTVCPVLSDPVQVDVEGQPCGGPITAATNTPTLAWSNVANENGYEWEVYDAPGCAGGLVASGAELADTTTAVTSPLASGTYSWRVRATGDGVAFCDSNWVCGCEFTVCPALPDPLQVDVEGQACGGPITVATDIPTLAWSDVTNENGYEWEVYDAAACTGSLVANGSTLADTTTAITTPLANGFYSWRVRATGDGFTFCDSNWVCGCYFTVDVPCPVTVSPEASPNPACLGNIQTFTSNAGGGTPPYQVEWDFDGDGFTDKFGDPVDYLYQYPGFYDAAVRVTDQNGSGCTTDWVALSPNVNVGHNSSPDVTPNPADCGQVQTFSVVVSAGVPPYQVEWDFNNDGFAEMVGNPVMYTYPTDGVHYLQFRVTDSNTPSCTAYGWETFGPVYVGPMPSPTVTPNPADCGEQQTFTSNATGGVLPYFVQWDFDGDGTADTNGDPVMYTYPAPGIY
ncbi:MAG: hypothetical protein JSV08_09430, partial [Acidobacteriota bacterium]